MASWIGHTLSAGVDAYYREQDSARRDEEAMQANRLRSLQAEQMRRNLAEQEESRLGAEQLAEDTQLSDVTILPGTPDTLPTVRDEATGPPEVPDPTGAGHDATLGNQPSTMTYTPGQKGEPALTMRGMTEADAIRKLGSKRYTAMMRTQEGREALKSAGLMTQADLAARQKSAQSQREYMASLRESMDAHRAGDPVSGLYKQAKALARLAETSDDPQWQRHYQDKAQMVLGQASALQQNKAEQALVRNDMTRQMDAALEVAKNPGMSRYLKYLETARGAESAIGQQNGMEMLERFAAPHMARAFANTGLQQFMAAVAQDMGKSPTLDTEASMRRVLAGMDPEARAAVLPDLLASDDPVVRRVLGLGDRSIKNAWEAASAMALGKYKHGTPEFAAFVMARVMAYETATRKGASDMEKTRLMLDLRTAHAQLAKEYSDQAKILKDPLVRGAQRDAAIREHEQTSIGLQSLRESIREVSGGKIDMIGDERARYDAAVKRNGATAKSNAGIRDGDDLKDPRNAEKVRKANLEFRRLMEDEGLDPYNPPPGRATTPQ